MHAWKDLLHLDDLVSVPIRLKVHDKFYWITGEANNLKVLADQCAHMGSPLENVNTGFICNSHGWKYDIHGNNEINSNPSISSFKTRISKDGFIQSLLPIKSKLSHDIKINSDLTLHVHAHACIQVKHKGFDILFDPWLKGKAYYGSWELFPSPKVTPEELEVDCIIITHPHPDHFSLDTLRHFDKNIEVYFPEFSSDIIKKGLGDLGFKNLVTPLWGEEIALNSSISIKFLRPRSMWEDSAVLVKVQDEDTDFVWLNQVDAGLPYDASEIGRIDLLSCAFDQGASGYPLTWENLNRNRQAKILEMSKKNTLTLLPQLCKQLDVKYFLPFAGHWRLSRPEHQKYSRLIPHTTFDELKKSFDQIAPEIYLVDIYPGESFDLSLNKKQLNIDVRNQVKTGYTPPSLVNQGLNMVQYNLDKVNFLNFMNKLVLQALDFSCENVTFEIKVQETSDKFRFEFSEKLGTPHFIEVLIPYQIFKLLADGQANWDHVAIGYWGIWNRKNDSYPANFMRLLQSGPINKNRVSTFTKEIFNMAISDIIELDESKVPSLLSRAGLPCVSCTRLNSETLGQALQIHNIDTSSINWILNEIRSFQG